MTTDRRLRGSLQVDFGDWLDPTQLEKGRIAVMLAPIWWDDVEIPAFTRTDGSSVPWFVWWFLPAWGDISTIAAVIHDYFCGCLDNSAPVKGGMTRKECDTTYREVLLYVGMNYIKAQIAWFFVRVSSIVSKKG